MKARILALSGSPRRESLNDRLLDIAANGARDAGAEVTTIQLIDFALPVYDVEWETQHGLPEPARTLQTLVSEHHGLLIATPEQNGGYTALLKNGIDWISRRDDSDPSRPLSLSGKTAALISASSGSTGGWRAQLALQMVLNRLGVFVLPTSFVLPEAHLAFAPNGKLRDATTAAAARHVGESLVRIAALLATGNV
jgi:chromate reductase, NAD(P)H dehydrogenase (quinone)